MRGGRRLGAFLGVVACIAVTTACDAGKAARTTEPTATVTTSLEARLAERAGPPRAETPTAVRLPSGTRVPVRPAGTGADGLLEVPADVRLAGWWRGGSRLGDPFGSTLLAGHVDSVAQGLGPYAELLRVRPGDRVVLRSAHLRQVFAVRSLRLLPQGSLRDHPWLYSAAGIRRLTMVTCAPPYDAARGGYQNLAVVTAVPVSRPRPGPRS